MEHTSHRYAERPSGAPSLAPVPRCPRRGEIWLLRQTPRPRDGAGSTLQPASGTETAWERPTAVMVVSDDIFNAGPSGLILALPLTEQALKLRTHVALAPAHSGLDGIVHAQCEHLRAIAVWELERPCGIAATDEMSEVEFRLKALLGMRF